MKRFATLMGALLVLALALGACGPSAPQTIKIGLNAELTGGIPVVGESCKNAAQLAVKEVNDAGGVGSRR